MPHDSHQEDHSVEGNQNENDQQPEQSTGEELKVRASDGQECDVNATTSDHEVTERRQHENISSSTCNFTNRDNQMSLKNNAQQLSGDTPAITEAPDHNQNLQNNHNIFDYHAEEAKSSNVMEIILASSDSQQHSQRVNQSLEDSLSARQEPQ